MDHDLYKYLQSFLTESRISRFHDVIKHRTRHISFVIEDVFQSHNASAVVRSCDCFGIQDLHVIEGRNEYRTDKNIAMGAGKWVSIHKYKDEEKTATNCLNHLKKKGYKIAATSPHEDGFTLDDIPIDEPLAVVFGTEMQGITDEVKENADYFLKIPMYGFTESLNISVAAAMTAQNLYTRLIQSDVDWQLSDKKKKDILFQWIKKSIKDPERIIDNYYRDKDSFKNQLT